MTEYVRKFFRMSDDELDAMLCAHFEQGLKAPDEPCDCPTRFTSTFCAGLTNCRHVLDKRRQSGDRRAMARWEQQDRRQS